VNWLWQFLYRHLIEKKIADSELFDAHSKMGIEAIDMMRFSVRIEFWCVLLVIPAVLSGFWWLLPILFFAIMMCETGRGLIINKSKSGFPYLEATDAIGLFIAVVFWGFISLVWFIIAVTQ
jgi:hypothetical protein